MLQVVCVSWGDRYSPRYINGLFRAIKRHAQREFTFVCITDMAADHRASALDEAITVKPFPDLGIDSEILKIGCRLKLSIFKPGVLDPELPTLFLDLDTMVRGDVTGLEDKLRRTPAMYMMASHWVPHWRFAKLYGRFSEQYYFGNSSVLLFYPGQFQGLLDSFVALMRKQAQGLTSVVENKAIATDDRFISLYARGTTRVFSTSVAVRFPREYMSRISPLLARLWTHVPSVQSRRARLVLITFDGAVKPDVVAALKPGEFVRQKRLRVFYDHPEFTSYWRDIVLS